jgi:hypothetical protein
MVWLEVRIALGDRMPEYRIQCCPVKKLQHEICGTIVQKIPLNPPFSKGEVYIFSFPPSESRKLAYLKKGGQGGF